jgi:hypothetical protein
MKEKTISLNGLNFAKAFSIVYNKACECALKKKNNNEVYSIFKDKNIQFFDSETKKFIMRYFLDIDQTHPSQYILYYSYDPIIESS